MQTNDPTLLNRWANRRDAEAFKELASRHAAMVYATCLRILANATEAEDVTQECFEKLATANKTPKGHLGAWLHRVATNASLNRIRAENRRKEREARFAAEQTANSELDWNDVCEHMDEAIADLPEKFRGPVVAHFLEFQSHAAIAKTIGTSRQTVTYRIGKGLEQLGKSLKKRSISITATALAGMLTSNIAKAAPVPASLTASLGKIALAESAKVVATGVSVTGTAGIFGGLLAMKNVALAAALVLALIGLWSFWPQEQPGFAPDLTEEEAPSTAEQSAGQITENQTQPPGFIAGVLSRALDEAAQTSVPDQSQEPLPAARNELATITGKVYKVETGEPVAGVKMYIEPSRDASGKLLEAETDQNGVYSFEMRSPGTYKVERTYATPGLPGRRESEAQTVTVKAGQILDNVDFPILMGIRAAGKVVDAEGRPIAEARVEGRDRNDYMSLETYTTGNDGTFELFGFKQTQVLTLEAEKDDALASEIVGPLSLAKSGLSDIVLTLHPTATIAGRVIDSRGRPISDMLVQPAPKTEYQRLMGRGQARTASDGTFEISGLAAGSYDVMVLPKEAATYKRPIPPGDRIELAHGQTVRGIILKIEEDTGLIIAGRIVDNLGRPVKSADVNVRGGPHYGIDYSNAEGYYEVTGLMEGYYSVQVSHKQYAKASLEDVEAGNDSVDFKLQSRGAIEGRIVAADTGRAIPQFQILHIDDHNRYSTNVRLRFQQRLDQEGRFRIELVEPGPATVIAKAPGYGEASLDVPFVGSAETVRNIEIRLAPAVSLTGIVVDPEGAPVADVGIIPGPVSPNQSPDTLAMTRTGPDGTFSLEDLSLDLSLISAHHPDFGLNSTPITLMAGRENHITIELLKGASIIGTVRHDGRPWAGQDVELYLMPTDVAPFTRAATKTSEAGEYRFDHVRTGEAMVMVRGWQQFEEQTRGQRDLVQRPDIQNGETTILDFDFLPTNAGLEGWITFNGEPPRNATVSLQMFTPSGIESRFGRVENSGWYQFEDLPAGTVWVGVSIQVHGNMIDKILDVEINEDEVVQHDIELAAGAHIAGTVSGLGEREVAMVTVLRGNVDITPETMRDFLSDTSLLATRASIQANGPYEIPGLAPGVYTIFAIGASLSPPTNADTLPVVRSFIDVVELPGEGSTQLDIHLD